MRYTTIEGINFDLKNERSYIDDNGKDAFFARKAETCWNDPSMPINEPTKTKRITAVYDAAMAYKEPAYDALAAAADQAGPIAQYPPPPPPPAETEAEKKAREKKEKDAASGGK